MAIQEN